MPRFSLADRNVFVWDRTSNTVVGGCRQFGSTSISEFFFCLRLFISDPVDFQLYHQENDSYVTQADGGNILIGNYFVVSSSTRLTLFRWWFLATPTDFLVVTLTNEEARNRIISGSSPHTSVVWAFPDFSWIVSQSYTFRDRVRARDVVCKLTGLDESLRGWTGVNPCHIIPRSHARSFVWLFVTFWLNSGSPVTCNTISRTLILIKEKVKSIVFKMASYCPPAYIHSGTLTDFLFTRYIFIWCPELRL